MAKDLKLDEFKIDDDLDFDYDISIDSTLSQESKSAKERTPVGKVLNTGKNFGRGAASAAVDTLVSPNFYRQLLRKTLPPTFGDIDDAVGTTTKGLYELYDQSAKEIKPRLNRISKRVDQILPEDQRLLKKLVGKIIDKTGGKDSSYSGEDQGQIDDQNVSLMIADVFKAQSTQNKIAETKQVMRDAIQNKRYKETQGITLRMQQDMSALRQYTTSVTQAYQKKSLELQLRTYLGQRSYFTRSLEIFEQIRAQNEMVVKNTALPEYAKITQSEKFMELGREHFINSLYGDGGIIKQGFDRLKKSAAEFVDGMGRKLDSVEFGLEGIAGQKQMLEEQNQMFKDMGIEPLSKAEMAGMAAAGIGIDYVQGKITPKLKEYFDKNPKLKEKLAKAAQFATNPSGKIASFRNSDKWAQKMQMDGLEGKAATFFDFLLDHFTDRRAGQFFKTGTNLDELDNPTMGFDKRAHVSLTNVIPGYLAMINREVSMLRTGQDQPLMMYDYEAGNFTTKTGLQSKIMNVLKREVQTSAYASNVKSVSDTLLGDRSYTDEQRRDMDVFVSRLSREGNINYTFDEIKESKAFNSLSPEAQAMVKSILEDREDSDDREQKIAALTKAIRETKGSAPSMSKTIDRYVKAGYGDMIAESGIVAREEGGFGDVDDELYRFLEENSIIRSDMNVKKGIKPTNPEKLAKSLDSKASSKFKNFVSKLSPKQAYEGMKKTKLYDWFYKRGVGDGQQHSGPMAQDVKKNLGEDAAPGGKGIDLQTMNGAFFGAIQHIGSKIENLFKWGSEDEKVSGNHPLKNIDKNIAKIAKILETKGAAQPTAGGYGYRPGFSLGYMFDSAVQGGKNIYQGTKDNIVNPFFGKVSELWNNNKDGLKEGATLLFNKAVTTATSLYDSASGFVKNVIPGWFRKGKEFVTGLIEKVGGYLDELKDVYLPDSKEPVIRAAKVRMGFYIDEATGEPLTTMKQILECKNNIVDASGNIILSIKDKASGLYDRYGETIRTRFLLGRDFIAGVGKRVMNKFRDSAIKLIELSKGGFSGLKDWWKNIDTSMPEFGLGFIGQKSHDELVNIRDILLGDVAEVRKRLKKSGVKKAVKNIAASITGSGSGGSDISSDSTEGSVSASSPFSMQGIASRYQNAKNGLLNKVFGQPDENGQRPTRLGDKATELRGRIRGKYDDIKGRVSGRLDKMKPGLSAGLGRMKGRIGGWLGMGASLVGGMFGGNSSQTPEQEVKDPYQPEDTSKQVVINKARRRVSPGEQAWNDKDANGERDGGLQEREDKIEALKKSREKDPLKADLGLRYKSGENVIDTMMAKAGQFMDVIKGGMSSIFDLAGNLFGSGKAGGLLKGASTTFGNLARGTVSLLTGGSKASAATRVAMTAGRGALMYGGLLAKGTMAALSIGTSALVSVGGALLTAISSPVIAVPLAIAAATYGLYKLYKYAHRNDANDYERLRLRQYGFAHKSSLDRYNNHIYLLEEYLQDGRVGYEGGRPYLLTKKIDQEELLATFSIDKNDEKAVKQFTAWFQHRFKPFFFAHLGALVKIDNKKKLKDVKDLEDEQKVQYLNDTKFVSGPYSYDISPLGDDVPMDVNDSEIVENYDNLIKKLQIEIDKNGTKAKNVEKPKENVKAPVPLNTLAERNKEADQKIDQAKREEENRRRNAWLAARGALGQGDGAQPNETPSTGTNGDSQPSVGVPNNLPMAKGPVASGDSGMQYINLRNGSKLDGLSPAMLKQFLGMAEEYGKLTGKTISVNSGTRTYAEQAHLYKTRPGWAARPGRSLHEFGLALDINSGDANELEKLGLMKKYGFTRPIGQEPWHIEPAGIQRSIDLAKKDANERERMVEASIGRGGGGFATVDNAAKGRRNHELAMSLLGVGSKVVDQKQQLDQQNENTASLKLDTGSANPVQTTGFKQAVTDRAAASFAANDAVARQQSQTQNLPNVSAADTQALSVGEPETKPSDSRSPATVTADGDVVAIIEEAARKTGVDPNTLKAFAAMESDFNPKARAHTGTASGLMQITRDTWNELLRQKGSKYGLGPGTSPFDPMASALMGGEYLKQNMQSISRVKSNPNTVDAYLTYFLGPAGARTFLSANPQQIGAQVMPDAARANRNIFFDGGRALTIGEIYNRVTKKVRDKAARYGIKVDVSGPGLKAPSGEASTGVSGSVDVNLTSAAPTGINFATVAPPMPGASGGSRGLSFDNSSPISTGTAVESGGQIASASNNAKLENLFEKSIGIEEESLKTLKDILKSLSKENLTEAFATAVAAMPKPEKEESIQEKDKVRMGRTAQATGSSLDLRRKSA